MPSAKLIKTLEREGFELDFPSYRNIEEIIIEVIMEKDSRLSASLPLFLMYDFDYPLILKKLKKGGKEYFNKIILISNKIYKKEGIKSELGKIISKHKIRGSLKGGESDYYLERFRESKRIKEKSKEKRIREQSKLRLNLDMNKSLRVLFSPAKIRIMDKIFNHEKLTNTELKYYYKAISNISKATLNKNLQDYLKVIETTKKLKEDAEKKDSD